jgi:hypothetical protein
LFVLAAAVGAEATPVNVGDAMLALRAVAVAAFEATRASAVACAVLTGLLASEVFVAFPRPTSLLTRLRFALAAATDATSERLLAFRSTVEPKAEEAAATAAASWALIDAISVSELWRAEYAVPFR